MEKLPNSGHWLRCELPVKLQINPKTLKGNMCEISEIQVERVCCLMNFLCIVVNIMTILPNVSPLQRSPSPVRVQISLPFWEHIRGKPCAIQASEYDGQTLKGSSGHCVHVC